MLIEGQCKFCKYEGLVQRIDGVEVCNTCNKSKGSLPRVFVVQKQMRWSAEKKDLVPKFDLSTAEEYGKLEFLLSPSAAPFNSEPIIAELKEKLKTYSDNDYLLLIGNPALIGFVVAIASQINNGNVKLLQYSGKDRRYILIHGLL